jgi:hypothetical protein
MGSRATACPKAEPEDLPVGDLDTLPNGRLVLELGRADGTLLFGRSYLVVEASGDGPPIFASARSASAEDF